MKTGRNDPCPCGSGKKYKKCCLEKDQQAERTAAAAAMLAAPRAPALEPPPDHPPGGAPAAPPSPRASTPEEPPDPHMEAINARWEAFEAADYEGKLSLFTRSLAEPELMDGEMAFEMLSFMDWRLDASTAAWNGVAPKYQLLEALVSRPSKALAHLVTQPKTIA